MRSLTYVFFFASSYDKKNSRLELIFANIRKKNEHTNFEET